MQKMIQDPHLSNILQPILFHPDLHMRNIFVSEEDLTVPTAVIDWQSSSTKPAFWYAHDTPDFAQKEVDIPDNDKSTSESELHNKAFGYLIRSQLPRTMLAPLKMDEAYFRLFQYGHRTWIQSAAAFRVELIQTARRWKELGFAGECPFPSPSKEEYAGHLERYREFEEDYRNKKGIAQLLNIGITGWVPAEGFETTKLANKEMFAACVKDSQAEEGSRYVEAEIRDA